MERRCCLLRLSTAEFGVRRTCATVSRFLSEFVCYMLLARHRSFLGGAVFRVWTHREFDERVFRRTVHEQTGPEKTWIGRLLSHRHPASWTLQAVRGRQTSDFFISLRCSQMVLFKMRHISKHDCTNNDYVTIIITSSFFFFFTYQKPIHMWFVVSYLSAQTKQKFANGRQIKYLKSLLKFLVFSKFSICNKTLLPLSMFCLF